jgi:dTDP-4-amino-4,6-dideoxygalactose transaminase
MGPDRGRAFAALSGTAGLTLALRALAPANCRVGLPATICPNVVAAILAAGCRPFFLDIERTSLGLDPASLEAEIGALGAVIAVHALGQPCRIEDIARISRAHSCLLLEDCAQADGASVAGRAVGSWGDVGIFSYGRGKIIDLGHGGLVAANSDDAWLRLKQAFENLPHDGDPSLALDANAAMNVAYRDLYNTRRRSDPNHSSAAFFRTMLDAAQAPLAPAAESKYAEIQLARTERLESTVTARRRKSDLYRQALADIPGLEFAPQSSTGAPWRFNIFLPPAARDLVLDSMLAEGLNVSSWHPDIRAYLPFSAYDSGEIANAAWYSQSVLNLWLDDETGEQDVVETARTVRRRLEAMSLIPTNEN